MIRLNAAITFILVLRRTVSGSDVVSYWKKQSVFYSNKTMFMCFPVWHNEDVTYLLTNPLWEFVSNKSIGLLHF